MIQLFHFYTYLPKRNEKIYPHKNLYLNIIRGTIPHSPKVETI